MSGVRKARAVVGTWTVLPALVALIVLLGPAGPPGVRAQEVAEPYGVVSVQVTYQHTDPVMPWNKNVEQNVRGNAAVVAGRRLLTTADLVKDANLIEVRKFGRYPDYAARIVLVDYEVNLALLEVDDPAFWEGLLPLPTATAPVTGGRFVINRWRGNGRFEQGTGEVVDVRMATSPFGTVEMPVMRASSGMSGLGWAEVLTVEGRVTGLVTSANEQQLQAVSSTVLQLFLDAAARGPYPGFAQRGFSWQQLNQPHLRAYFGLGQEGTGILVRKVYPSGTGAKALQPGDILQRIGGYAVDPEGMIDHPQYGVMPFSLAVNESLAPTLSAEITRDGKRRSVELERHRFAPDAFRVPPPRFDEATDYVVFGGLVLRELTLGYLRAWGNNWRSDAPARLVMAYELNALREADEPPGRIVFVSKVLPDASNLGYDDVGGGIVTEVNGRPVRSLDDFRAAVAEPESGHDVVTLLPGMGRSHLVYDASAMEAVNARVAERYGVPQHR